MKSRNRAALWACDNHVLVQLYLTPVTANTTVFHISSGSGDEPPRDDDDRWMIRKSLSLGALVVLCAPLLVPIVSNSAMPTPHLPDGSTQLPGGNTQAAITRTGMQYPLPGPRNVIHPFQQPDQKWSAGHRGVDLDMHPGSPLLAPASGTVTVVQYIVDRPVLVIKHPSGLRSSFEPINTHLRTGDAVAAGQQIGYLATDQSSHCSPACLHWGVRRQSLYIDPMSLLEREPVVLLPRN